MRPIVRAVNRTRLENQSKGGLTTLANHGVAHMSALGKKGGAAVVKKRGKAYMRALARKGGAVTAAKRAAEVEKLRAERDEHGKQQSSD